MSRSFLQMALAFLLFLGSACQQVASKEQEEKQADAQVSTVQVPPNGKALFERYCTGCHGGDGKLAMNGAKDLSTSAFSQEEVAKIIAQGSENKAMMAYGNVLDASQIEDVATYVLAFRQ